MKCKRILVVDDDEIVLNSCKRILELEGYELILVSNAKGAIKKLQNEHFDVIIMDVKMPDKDGIYLLEKIREKWPPQTWSELPILVMSGYPTPETKYAVIEKGAKDFISKPFTPDELVDAVNKLIQRSENDESTRH